MKNYQKFLSALAIFSAAGMLACAQEYIDESSEKAAPVSIFDSLNMGTFREGYVMLEGFGMSPYKSMATRGTRPMSGGVFATAGVSLGEGNIAWDISAIFSYSKCEDEAKSWWYIYGASSGDIKDRGIDEYDLTQEDYLLGIQIGATMEFDETFNVAFGIMGGVNYRTFEAETKNVIYSERRTKDDTSAVGLFGGAYLRGSVQVSKHWSLTASYRMFVTWVPMDELKVDTQITDGLLNGYWTNKIDPRDFNLYQGFTVGAKYTF